MMDRAMLLRHLEQAERHIEQGRVHIERQRERAAQLARQGDAEELPRARSLLAQFEEMQAMHIADRGHILKKLAEVSAKEKKG